MDKRDIQRYIKIPQNKISKFLKRKDKTFKKGRFSKNTL